MKTFCILFTFTLVGACATTKYSTKIENLKANIKLADSTLVVNYANTISEKELSTHLYQFASDDFKGRKVGEAGQKKAAQFLKSYYQNENIASPLGGSNYYQTVPSSFLSNEIKASENVMAYVKGAENAEEVIIISAHLDHLGVSDSGEIHNGADDDGSGNVAIMEIAQAFNLAKKDGHAPKRSLLFIHFTAEEIGKRGSQFYTQNPVFPIENTVANLNIDMIGRVDDAHLTNKNYIYLIGSDRLSKELHYTSEKVNDAYFDMNLDYTYNVEGQRNNYYKRSDHYSFAEHDVPVIFYFNGEHDDYHEVTDTPEKIDYNLLETRTKLIFATAWQLANQEHRIANDDNSIFLK
ncbi:M28 family peptidase [Hwangdonia lutea]|uniref:M28 family peptidase n=1 Tax=Hwangdonia lutea TaxID=3075823 RepID=A0AA97ELL8_9FLAO|nr:M28 family peptidase [Hwangdonia sp. SCSIO 19198]WOD43691.1 M28 family peptidase [Hwangdonia sp. SCSIO 19198]